MPISLPYATYAFCFSNAIFVRFELTCHMNCAHRSLAEPCWASPKAAKCAPSIPMIFIALFLLESAACVIVNMSVCIFYIQMNFPWATVNCTDKNPTKTVDEVHAYRVFAELYGHRKAIERRATTPTEEQYSGWFEWSRHELWHLSGLRERKTQRTIEN